MNISSVKIQKRYSINSEKPVSEQQMNSTSVKRKVTKMNSEPKCLLQGEKIIIIGQDRIGYLSYFSKSNLLTIESQRAYDASPSYIIISDRLKSKL